MRNDRKERKKAGVEDGAQRERDITNKYSEVKRGGEKVTTAERRGRREEMR